LYIILPNHIGWFASIILYCIEQFARIILYKGIGIIILLYRRQYNVPTTTDTGLYRSRGCDEFFRMMTDFLLKIIIYSTILKYSMNDFPLYFCSIFTLLIGPQEATISQLSNVSTLFVFSLWLTSNIDKTHLLWIFFCCFWVNYYRVAS